MKYESKREVVEGEERWGGGEYQSKREERGGNIVQELRESRGGRPGLSVLTSLIISVDVKLY